MTVGTLLTFVWICIIQSTKYMICASC